jgi:hypothetical protein
MEPGSALEAVWSARRAVEFPRIISMLSNSGYLGFVECQAIEARLHAKETTVPTISPFIKKKKPGIASNVLDATRRGFGSIVDQTLCMSNLFREARRCKEIWINPYFRR